VQNIGQRSHPAKLVLMGHGECSALSIRDYGQC
jgi:hypothetical protein